MNDPTRMPAVRETRAPSRVGGWLLRLLRPLFAKVAIAPETVERLERAFREGTVVLVLRSRRVLDPIFILSVLERLGLPQPRWMHDHYASASSGEPELIDSVRGGRPVLLFLRRPRTLTNPSRDYAERHVEALVRTQGELSSPLLFLPVSLLYSRKAGGIRRTIIDVIFGDREAPGRLRECLGFLFSRKDARFHVGAPIDVRAMRAREADTPEAVVARKIRWAIMHHLAREEAIRAGPPVRPAARTRQMVLKDPAVQSVLAGLAEEGEDPDALRQSGDRMLQRIAADIRPGWVRVLDAILNRIWRDIYDGIHVDDGGLARVWQAARRGPIVLVPSHKSHIDYLVLSQVFYANGMMPPHIAAGDNLAIPVLGTIFRRTGAFFIRRSFKGDRLYSAVLAAYVRRLLKDGHAVEFFIEGGRSRSGKQLAPKLGILGMCVEPVLERSVTDVWFVPVSIGYEKVIEAQSYARELGGGKKKKEDLGALLSASKVLRSRYGRVYVDFDEPISLLAFAAARGFEIGASDGARTRALVGKLAERIAFGINQATRVTPTGLAALVLLAHARRGTAQRDLLARASVLAERLAQLGARLSETLAPATRDSALTEALARLASDSLLTAVPSPDGETIYQLDERGRQALDYYKNNSIHFLVPAAIAGLALLVTGEPSDEAVLATARRISALLEHEFSMREGDLEAAIERLVEWRIAQRGEDGLRATLNGAPQLIELGGLVAVFLESYAITAGALDPLAGALPRPDLEKRVLERAQRLVLEGRLLRAEAVSAITFKNAIGHFVDLGWLERTADGLAMREDRTGNAKALLKTIEDWLAALS